MKTVVKNKTYDEERALYNLSDALVEDCVFDGPADGESALKEANRIDIKNCRFSLRYPLWHVTDFNLSDSSMSDTTRAALWYSKNGNIENTALHGIKAVRECKNISVSNSSIVSEEFGWRTKGLSLKNCTAESQYFLFESRDVSVIGLNMKGKYSFQYTKNVTVTDSVLDTKDAFWHAENVTVKNCTVKGEYLGWYSKNLKFINCHIEGTQPLCYAKNLKLINCTMDNTDLSFEYSSVIADVKGKILSIKNPRSGKIVADSIGEVILENSVVGNNCKIKTNDRT